MSSIKMPHFLCVRILFTDSLYLPLILIGVCMVNSFESTTLISMLLNEGTASLRGSLTMIKEP